MVLWGLFNPIVAGGIDAQATPWRLAAIETVKGSEAETRTAVNAGRATSRVGLWGSWPELRPRRFVTVEGVRDGAFEKMDDDHGV